MFLGIILTVIGVSFIVEDMLSIDIPVGRILLGVLVIYFGFKLIFTSSGISFHKKVNSSVAILGNSDFRYPPNMEDQNELKEDDDDEDIEEAEAGSDTEAKDEDSFKKAKYQVIFGSSSLDLKNVNLSEGNVKMKIDCVFGEMKVYVPKDMPIVISSKSVFAETKLPGKNLNAFGEFTYESETSRQATNKLYIDANAVFGSLKFIQE